MIAGIMKVWNEIEIIEDALRHLSGLSSHMFVYDDCSDDGTAEVLEEWASEYGNLTVVHGDERSPDRPGAQGGLLNVILGHAKTAKPDWIIQIDADERLEIESLDLDRFDGFRFRLFDFYITPDDVDKPYQERLFMGPEFRDILMMYRAFPDMRYGWMDQREMWGYPKTYKITQGGFARHYGKAISVERWERQCDYYADNFPEPYKTKWALRRGKAIHDEGLSDFGHPLVRWENRHQGIRLG